MNSSEDLTHIEFSKAWLLYMRNEAGNQIWLENEWVIGTSIDWAFNEPFKLWNAILEISRRDLSDSEITQLGTSFIEALIAWNYEEFVERVFREAKRNRNICEALAKVYPPEEYEDDFEERTIALP